MNLTAEFVRETMLACFYTDDETVHLAPGERPDGAVMVEGITRRFGFNPERIIAKKDEIAAALAQLPDSFRDGMSFLMAPVDRHGNHWAEHATVEELFCLGMAAGLVTCLLPRDMWGVLPGVLPGGMPYYQVLASPATPTNTPDLP